MNEFLSRLATVHTRVIDVLDGYDVMRRRAEPELIPHLDRAIRLHREHHGLLHELLIDLGVTPDDSGSFQGTMNRAVVRIRDVFDDLDKDVLPRLVQGEEALAGLYDDALDDAPPGSMEQQVLLGQRAELRKLIAGLRVTV